MIDKFEIKLGEEAIGKRIRAILGVPEAILTNEIISSSIFKKQAENFINKNIAEFLELIDKNNTNLLEISSMYYIHYHQNNLLKIPLIFH